MRRVSRVLLAFLAPLLHVGCATDAATAGWSTSVDTATATIRVVNTPPEGGATPTRLAEEVRLFAADGRHLRTFHA